MAPRASVAPPRLSSGPERSRAIWSSEQPMDSAAVRPVALLELHQEFQAALKAAQEACGDELASFCADPVDWYRSSESTMSSDPSFTETTDVSSGVVSITATTSSRFGSESVSSALGFAGMSTRHMACMRPAGTRTTSAAEAFAFAIGGGYGGYAGGYGPMPLGFGSREAREADARMMAYLAQACDQCQTAVVTATVAGAQLHDAQEIAHEIWRRSAGAAALNVLAAGGVVLFVAGIVAAKRRRKILLEVDSWWAAVHRNPGVRRAVERKAYQKIPEPPRLARPLFCVLGMLIGGALLLAFVVMLLLMVADLLARGGFGGDQRQATMAPDMDYNEFVLWPLLMAVKGLVGGGPNGDERQAMVAEDDVDDKDSLFKWPVVPLLLAGLATVAGLSMDPIHDLARDILNMWRTIHADEVLRAAVEAEAGKPMPPPPPCPRPPCTRDVFSRRFWFAPLWFEHHMRMWRLCWRGRVWLMAGPAVFLFSSRALGFTDDDDDGHDGHHHRVSGVYQLSNEGFFVLWVLWGLLWLVLDVALFLSCYYPKFSAPFSKFWEEFDRDCIEDIRREAWWAAMHRNPDVRGAIERKIGGEVPPPSRLVGLTLCILDSGTAGNAAVLFGVVLKQLSMAADRLSRGCPKDDERQDMIAEDKDDLFKWPVAPLLLMGLTIAAFISVKRRHHRLLEKIFKVWRVVHADEVLRAAVEAEVVPVMPLMWAPPEHYTGSFMVKVAERLVHVGVVLAGFAVIAPLGHALLGGHAYHHHDDDGHHGHSHHDSSGEYPPFSPSLAVIALWCGLLTLVVVVVVRAVRRNNRAAVRRNNRAAVRNNDDGSATPHARNVAASAVTGTGTQSLTPPGDDSHSSAAPNAASTSTVVVVGAPVNPPPSAGGYVPPVVPASQVETAIA